MYIVAAAATTKNNRNSGWKTAGNVHQSKGFVKQMLSDNESMHSYWF